MQSVTEVKPTARRRAVVSGDSKSERTRRKLIAAAKQLFDRNGYRDTTIDDITGRAEVAHGTFYLYFKDKGELLQELLRTTLSQFNAIADIEPHSEEQMRAVIRQSLETYQRNRLLMRLLREVSAADPYFRAHYEELFSGALVNHLDRTIQRIQSQLGRPSQLDTRSAARAIVGMVESFAYGMFVGGERYTVDQAVETLTCFCAAAIGVAE